MEKLVTETKFKLAIELESFSRSLSVEFQNLERQLKLSQLDVMCQVRAANLNSVAGQLRANWRNVVIIYL